LTGFGFSRAGLGISVPQAALFDIVILEKGNAGGGALAGRPAMVCQATLTVCVFWNYN
jgi:hypothetical protein